MGRFKDINGQTRWQKNKEKVRDFFDKNGAVISAVSKSVVKVAVPRVSHVVEAITEIKTSKATQTMKDKAIEALNELLEDLEDETVAYEPVDPGTTPTIQPVDPTRLISTTWISKYIGAFILTMITIIFGGMWLTEIAHYWGICEESVPPADKATISGVFAALVGIRQISRGEMKKKILQSLQQIHNS